MSPTTSLGLADYASEAVSLFNNMKQPASIIAGALVPLGLLSPLPIQSPKGQKEGNGKKVMR